MGALSLPASGSVYLDSNGFIYSVECVEPFRTLLDPMWQRARAGDFVIVSSEIVVLETLVKPLREGDDVVERLMLSLFDAREVRLIPTTRELWSDAARLRADSNLTVPDALHAATALRTGCELFVTNDTDFRRLPDLPAVVLADLIDDEPPG